MAAKHMVKCPGCGERFDSNEEEYIFKSRRYWHKACFEKAESEKSQEEKDLEDLFSYIKQLYGKYDYVSTKKLIDKYHTENNFTYTGIKNTLKYWHEIKHNPVDKANGRIGIVPWMYEEAYRYYYDIWLNKNKTQPEQVKQYQPTTTEITIQSPQRDPMVKRKLFSVLDLEEED